MFPHVPTHGRRAARACRRYPFATAIFTSLATGAACAVFLMTWPATAAAEEPVRSETDPVTSHAHEHEHDKHDAVERILITASPLEHRRDELALPVTYLDREDVTDQLGSTIGETLRNQPGITVSGFARGASRPVIRGQDAFRVRVLEDGLSVGDVSDLSADHGVPTNPLLAERIEVLRGPATLRYGGGAIGGVVNTITDRIPTRLGEMPLVGSAFAGYDTATSGRDLALKLKATSGRMVWHLDGLFRESDDYEIPGSPGEQDNTAAQAATLSGAAAWIGDRGRVGVAVGRIENDYGIPAPEDPSDPVSIDMEQGRYELDAAWSPAARLFKEFRLRTVFSDYRHEEQTRLEGTAAVFDNEEWEGRAEALHGPLFGRAIGAVGLHWRTQDLVAGGEAAELLDPTETDTVAGYLFEEIPLVGIYAVQLGARVERTEVSGTPDGGSARTRSFTPLSASASLQAHSSEKLAAGLTVSASQRAPSSLELFAKGPHEATGTFERGNVDLDEETSLAFDLNFHGTVAGRYSYDVSAFYTRYSDFIFGRLTGRTCSEEGDCTAGEGGELDELVYEQDDADFYGAEASGRADLIALGRGRAGLDAQFDIVRARLDSGGNVPRIPPLRWGLGAWYEDEVLRGRVGFLRNEEQSDIATSETATGGYTMLAANLSLLTLPGDGRFPVEWTLRGDNLLDERARNHVSFLKDELLLPGRSVSLGVRVDF
jgi:iron complex outermembrane receptor protein